jgi:uncharacterized SAM-binding protein YcdF (DUF218 family)
VGAALTVFARTRVVGQRLVLGGGIWLILLSLGIPFDLAGRMLERRYPSQAALIPLQLARNAPWVVVLGGGTRPEPWLPVPARLSEAALYRVIEGIRLHRLLPGTRLVFTGYGRPGQEPTAEVGARLALAMGVDPEFIVVDTTPRTTGEEARVVKAIAGESPVVLVTSAVHMHRAVRLFRREGVSVVPAPTGHSVSTYRSPTGWLRPSARRLAYADAVAHELVGLMALRFQ